MSNFILPIFSGKANSGDKVAFIAPSSPLPIESLSYSRAYFEKLGFGIWEGTSLYGSERFLAGSDEARLADVMGAFSDPSVKLIVAARGGYGSMRLLDKIDYDVIRQNPKPLVGFSDTTALQLGLLAQGGLGSYSGVTLYIDFKQGELDGLIEKSLWAALSGQGLRFDDLTVMREGEARGRLIGGCLSLFTTLVGTPYIPDLNGAILLLEEIKEEPYHVDRLLSQLRLAGVFDQIAGVVLGEFRECEAKNLADGNVGTVLAQLKNWVNGPVVSGLDYGHGPSRHVMPLGREVSLRGGVLEVLAV